MKKMIKATLIGMLLAYAPAAVNAGGSGGSEPIQQEPPNTLVSSGTDLTLLAGVRFLGKGNKFLVCSTGSPTAYIAEILSNGQQRGVAVPRETVSIEGEVFFGFADDLALSSDKSSLALSGLSTGRVTQFSEVAFGRYANPEEFNVGPPVPPFFSSQLGFANPVAYDAGDVLYAANTPVINLSNSVFRLSLTNPPVEFPLFDTATQQFDSVTALNAFDFWTDGKLYSPAPNNGSVLAIDLIEDQAGERAEYTEVFSGLEQPISVRVNDDGLLVTIDRTTGFVWKFQLGVDTTPTLVASLEPGLDNFDFYKNEKIMVTANRNRIWTVNLHNGIVKTILASPVALPNAISEGKSVDDQDKLYIADTYAIVVVNAFTGEVVQLLTPFSTPGLSSLNVIRGLHVTEDKIYALDDRSGLVAVLDRQTLAQLDLFGGFLPNNVPFSAPPCYPVEDNQGDLLVSLPENGQVVRVTRSGGQQVNDVVVSNVPVPCNLVRDGDLLYISDLGTTDCNGGLYVYDLTSGTGQATLLKSDLSRPKGVTVLDDDVLVVESAASRITAVDSSGNATVYAEDLAIQFAPFQPTILTPVPIGVISDITVSQSGTVFFGTNFTEGSIQYF